MSLFRSFVILLSALYTLPACTSEGRTGNTVQPNGSADASTPRQSVLCETPGNVVCHCPNGTLQGTQTCLETGELTPCECPDHPEPSQGQAQGEPDEVEALCPDLAGIGSCAATTYESQELPASILFLIDRSGSMDCNPPPIQSTESCEMEAVPADPNQPTKWEITRESLKNVFDNLLENNSNARVGLNFFSSDNMCGVTSDPFVGVNAVSDPQIQALNTAVDHVQPRGETPLVGGTILAYAHLHQEAGQKQGCVEPCGAPGNRYVVLLTDGEDSCSDPDREPDAQACTQAGSCTNHLLDSEARKATQANIRTFVIGAPGSEPARGFLSELAWVGGTAQGKGCVHDRASDQGNCHFDMTTTSDFASDLSAALKSISGKALSCEFAVPEGSGGLGPDQVNVQYRAKGTEEPVCLHRDDSAPCNDGADGWQFARDADGSVDTSRVVLCGATCDRIREDPAAKVDVILGCPVLE